MIPPFVRRCPVCGHVGLSRRFPVVDDDGSTRRECPACHSRIESIDNPWLN